MIKTNHLAGPIRAATATAEHLAYHNRLKRMATVSAPSAEVAIYGLSERILAGQVSPLATRMIDVKDHIDGQAHIGLMLPAAGFRGGDQAFYIHPFSVGQVAPVELASHPGMLPKPTEVF